MWVGEIASMMKSTFVAASAAEMITGLPIAVRVIEEATDRLEKVADLLEKIDESIEEVNDDISV